MSASDPELLEIIRQLSGQPRSYTYGGRALVTFDRITLIDMDPRESGLPNMLGQLDVQPGQYQLELRLVPIGAAAAPESSTRAEPLG